ncbi:MAG: ABC transporter ATP-binding protein [Puniceicoccaceae bacterium]
MADGPNINLQSVSKRFGEGPLVLEEVSLSAGSGEIVAIVGPSGCGKSTLLRLVADLLPATSGEISASGSEVDPAFIFQDPTLLPWSTVRDNIFLPSRLKGTGSDLRGGTPEEWANRLGLERALDYYPRQLSGGMRMRVSIARALSQAPNLLLLDEPFGALDAITRNRLNEELLELHAQSRWTAFFVTHSVSEAVFLSHRIVIMENHPGRVAATIENPLPFPRNAHTRELIEFQQRVAEATALLQEVLQS